MSGLNAAVIHNSRKHFPKRDGRHQDRLPIFMGPIFSPKTTTYLRSTIYSKSFVSIHFMHSDHSCSKFVSWESFSHALQSTNVIEDHALPAREDMSITTDM